MNVRRLESTDDMTRAGSLVRQAYTQLEGYPERGAGVGEAMVSWVFAEARRLDRHRVRIHTLDVMQGAQRLYKRMGFVREPAEDQTVDDLVLLAFVRHL